MHPYSTTLSKIIFDTTFFKPHYLASVSHSICSFIVITKNVGSAFRYPIGINFHRRFPPGVNNASLLRASYSATTCQYPLYIFTVIKYFASVSMS